MPLTQPALRFPDVEAWVVGYLNAQLLARPAGETYADGVRVVAYWNQVAVPAPMVLVRDDGGPRVGTVLKRSTLAVNVWARTEQAATELALLVAGLLERAPGNGAVIAHLGSTGPTRVADNTELPHRYLTADLVVRGADL